MFTKCRKVNELFDNNKNEHKIVINLRWKVTKI